MRKNLIVIIAVIAAFVLPGTLGVSAQFTIKIPKMPKVEKPKAEQPKADSNRPLDTSSPTTSSESTSSTYSTPVRKSQYDFVFPTAAPLLVRDSINIQAFTEQEYWKTPGKPTSSWVPTVRFSVFYDWEATLPFVVEYFNPDGSLWFSETFEGSRPTADRTVPLYLDNQVLIDQ